MENEQYDIEKLVETNNRERKMNSDFDDDDDLGMDFFKTMEEIYNQINKNEQKTTSELPNFWTFGEIPHNYAFMRINAYLVFKKETNEEKIWWNRRTNIQGNTT